MVDRMDGIDALASRRDESAGHSIPETREIGDCPLSWNAEGNGRDHSVRILESKKSQNCWLSNGRHPATSHHAFCSSQDRRLSGQSDVYVVEPTASVNRADGSIGCADQDSRDVCAL